MSSARPTLSGILETLRDGAHAGPFDTEMLTGSNAPKWDDATAHELAAELAVPRLELRAEVESTQDIAHALAESGAPHGTIVLADAQRAGRGRLGRDWSSEAGAGVWCTIIARPHDARAIDVLSVRLGVYIAEALNPLTADTPIQLKWPNDLLLDRKKLGGILVEARWSGPSLSWVAAGIGVNVRAPDVPLAAGFPRGVKRRDVLIAIASGARIALAAQGWLTADELARYRSRDALLGRHIVDPGQGSVAGIAESGALLVQTSRGIQEYRAGTIKYAEDA